MSVRVRANAARSDRGPRRPLPAPPLRARAGLAKKRRLTISAPTRSSGLSANTASPSAAEFREGRPSFPGSMRLVRFSPDSLRLRGAEVDDGLAALLGRHHPAAVSFAPPSSRSHHRHRCILLVLIVQTFWLVFPIAVALASNSLKHEEGKVPPCQTKSLVPGNWGR
jgi:hypothetical protein